jgi:pimeloyl-ACP methyl ester carboxylesterase
MPRMMSARHRFVCLGVAVMCATAPAATSAQAPAAPPPADRFVTLNGLRLHYLDWGNDARPPMVLVHGIGRVAHTFDHLVPAFRSEYHVLAIDMRGHGDSAWDPGANYLVEDHVKDFEAFVGALGLKRLTLWGNSTGGRVVQVYAGLHPDNVRALIVEDVGPERPKNISDNFARSVQRDAAGWASMDDLVAQLTRENQGIPEAQLRVYARYASKRDANGRLVWKRDPQLAKGFVETELWQYVRRITSPALYVLGGRSTIVPPETQEELRNTIPGVRITTMAGLGHYPSQEQPAAFERIVKEFLARAK